MKYKKSLTNNQEKQILKLFYRTELRKDEVIIDNTSVTIAKELNIKISTVNNYLQTHLDEKFENINDRI